MIDVHLGKVYNRKTAMHSTHLGALIAADRYALWEKQSEMILKQNPKPRCLCFGTQL